MFLLLEFDVWDFKQNPFPKDVSIEMIYNAVKLPLLRFYISTQPKSVPSEESDDDDHGRADCVSEPDDEPDNEPDDEQSVDRSYRQDSTDEPHDVLTDSSVTRENLASSSQGIRTLVIRDPMAFSVGKNYAIFEDDPDSEIISGAKQTVNDDSLSDALIYQLDELPQSLAILVLHHSNSLSEMIEAFSDPEIASTCQSNLPLH